jgi:hypothetical protein
MDYLDERAKAAVQNVIERNRDRLLASRGFLAARPGFALTDGRLVREPAIIAYVDRRLPDQVLTVETALPAELEGYKVDVIEPDPLTRLELSQDEPAASAGLPIAAGPTPPTYEPIDDNPIDREFRLSEPLLCHVGPDTGWTPLKEFIEGAQGRLTAAIYDFSADYIAAQLIDTLGSTGAEFDLTIDDDLRDNLGDGEPAIQQRLKTALGNAFSPAVVFCRAGARFPSAYHEKVAVREDHGIWLSSGNWTPSSQPNIDPINNPASAKSMYRKGNREWHLILQDAGLADVFKTYILHDKNTAEQDNQAGPPGPETSLDVLVPVEALLEAGAELAGPVQPVAPRQLPEHGQSFKVQPLLSPDNYAERVTEWMKSAERSLYLQYSYITWPDAAHDADFRSLLQYLATLSQRDDFDLKIIMGDSSAREKARRLAENGFAEKCLRAQGRIHNKGAVVDGTSVLISSQNWSGDGFLRNRDAGLIVHDAEVAHYYSDIFLSDWDERARDPFAGSSTPVLIAEADDPTPPGFVRMSLKDYLGD